MNQTKAIQEISDMIGNHQFATFHVSCIDCGKDFDILVKRTSENSIEIVGGTMAKNSNSRLGSTDWMFKCDECFKAEPLFIGENEVYSRVVGFLRPVKYWNAGKQEEYRQRKVFDMPEGF